MTQIYSMYFEIKHFLSTQCYQWKKMKKVKYIIIILLKLELLYFEKNTVLKL